jgi:hypothetical protein
MDNPYVNIIAHPTGRLLGERAPYDIDMERLITAAKERGCCLELNAEPDRLDLNEVHAHAARDWGQTSHLDGRARNACARLYALWHRPGPPRLAGADRRHQHALTFQSPEIAQAILTADFMRLGSR